MRFDGDNHQTNITPTMNGSGRKSELHGCGEFKVLQAPAGFLNVWAISFLYVRAFTFCGTPLKSSESTAGEPENSLIPSLSITGVYCKKSKCIRD